MWTCLGVLMGLSALIVLLGSTSIHPAVPMHLSVLIVLPGSMRPCLVSTALRTALIVPLGSTWMRLGVTMH
jgi:hypothetical protein